MNRTRDMLAPAAVSVVVALAWIAAESQET
jgi:hypothetical protein